MAGRAEHRDQPAQPRPRLLARGRAIRPSSAPGRRPPHTLSPAIATTPTAGWRRCSARWAATRQPQILLQLAARLFRHEPEPGRRRSTPVGGRCAARSPGSTPGPPRDGPHVLVEGHAPADVGGGAGGARSRRARRRRRSTARSGTPTRSCVDAARDAGRRRRSAGPRSGLLPACEHRAVASARPPVEHPRTTVDAMRVDSQLLLHGPDARRRRSRPSRPPTRRYGNDAVIECYENLIDWAKTADAARLRHDVAHRAPLPVRGLRGPART